MPICPRCGKSLSTDQALMYHLNKKNKCNLYACCKCNRCFNTKLDLQVHEMNCTFDCIDYKKILEEIPIGIGYLENGIIKYSNKYFDETKSYFSFYENWVLSNNPESGN